MVRKKQAVSRQSQSKSQTFTNKKGIKRFRPGTRALMEIRKFQSSTNLLLRKLPFARLVREVAYDMGRNVFKWQAMAILALQEAAEYYLINLFGDSYLCTLHAKRVTLKREDIRLCRMIRGREFA